MRSVRTDPVLSRLLDRVLSEGHSPAHLARQMVRFLRNALVAKVAGEESALLQISADERARARRVAARFTEEDLARFLQIMLRTHGELGYRQEQRFHLELGLLKLVHAQRLLPLDETWLRGLSGLSWPTGNLPEVIGGGDAARRALTREYLFISLFRACADSLASENASRLAAMQRAEKNIDDLLENLHQTFHRLRQTGIDEELFDVISGFEALAAPRGRMQA